MSTFAWATCVLVLCACSEKASHSNAPVKEVVANPDESQAKKALPPVTAPSASPRVVKVSMFGEVSIADGAIMLMDGGIHGLQGHSLTIPASGQTSWERRLDGFQPSGEAGSGLLELTEDEKTQVRGWANGLWQLAPKGKISFNPPIEQGAPRWVWAVVLRRGDEVRVVTGSGNSSPSGAPDPAKSALEWLVTRVDAASAVKPSNQR